MSDWSEQVRSQIRLVIEQIASLQARVDRIGGGKQNALAPYFAMLDSLYQQDLVIADVRDNSDLILRVEGEAFDGAPRLQLVTSIFDNVTTQVSDLTKVILGGWAEDRFPRKSVDIGLTGLAKGSLILGLSASSAQAKLDRNLLGALDTLTVSTRKALQMIDRVAFAVHDDPEDYSLEEVSESIDDPKVRDAALVAVQRISPTGRRGVDAVSVTGSCDRPPARLTPEHRRAIRQSLIKPVIHGEEREFIGEVREIDLDARRFDLRGIADEQVRDIRCAYRNVENVRPKQLIGAMVRVQGLVERSFDQIPRLMSVTSLELLRDGPE